MVMIICDDLWSEAVVVFDGADNDIFIFNNEKTDSQDKKYKERQKRQKDTKKIKKDKKDEGFFLSRQK